MVKNKKQVDISLEIRNILISYKTCKHFYDERELGITRKFLWIGPFFRWTNIRANIFGQNSWSPRKFIPLRYFFIQHLVKSKQHQQQQQQQKAKIKKKKEKLIILNWITNNLLVVFHAHWPHFLTKTTVFKCRTSLNV